LVTLDVRQWAARPASPPHLALGESTQREVVWVALADGQAQEASMWETMTEGLA
jgi:hypothetical protein